jgi:hypothetical protein
MLSEKLGEELQEDKVNNDCGLGEDLVLSFEVRLRKKFCQFAGRFRKLKIFRIFNWAQFHFRLDLF